MRRHTVRILLILVSLLFLLFLINPDRVQRSAYESVLFCTSVLIPSLFPGFVLSDLLIKLTGQGRSVKNSLFTRLFGLPSVLWRAMLIGLLAGFPAAADCSCRLVQNGAVTREEGSRCLAFTNNPGIVFVVCAVGTGLFGSFWIGLYLWTIQTLSGIITGILLAPQPHTPDIKRMPVHTGIQLKALFPGAVTTSVSAVLNVCGFVIFFRVLIDLAAKGIPRQMTQILFAGLLEMTSGISCLKEFNLLSGILASAMLGWSGFSVHFQILNTVSASDLSLRYYFPGKVLQTILSAILTSVSFPLLYGTGNTPLHISALLLITLVILLLFLRIRKEYLWKTRPFSTKKND